MYRLVSSDIKETAAKCFFQMYGENVFSDMVVATNDGQQFPAHKVVLWWSSPVFRQLLERNPHERPLVYLQATGQEVLGPILQFLYTGECEVASHVLGKVIDAARELGIAGLSHDQDLTDVTLAPDDGLAVALGSEEPLKNEPNPENEQQMILEKLPGSQGSKAVEIKEVCDTPTAKKASLEVEEIKEIEERNLQINNFHHVVEDDKVRDRVKKDTESKILKNADEFLKNLFLKRKQKIPLTSSERNRKYCLKKLLDPDHKERFILQRRETSRKHREGLSETKKEALKKQQRERKRAIRHKSRESPFLPNTQIVSFTLLKQEKFDTDVSGWDQSHIQRTK